MSRMENQFLITLAKKLGLDENTTQKGKEYFRVYQNKSAAMRVGISDVTKAVLCLDLASISTGVTFDKETALKLSGLKTRIYSSHLNTIEKLLGLDKPLSISEVCVQLSCTELKDLAEKILEKYKEAVPHADISHPQYVAISIWMASGLKSVKILKQNILTISRLKPAQWKELENSFNKFVDGVQLNGTKQKLGTKNTINTAESIHNYVKKIEVRNGSSKRSNGDKEVEDYAVWKERILRLARQAINTEEISI